MFFFFFCCHVDLPSSSILVSSINGDQGPTPEPETTCQVPGGEIQDFVVEETVSVVWFSSSAQNVWWLRAQDESCTCTGLTRVVGSESNMGFILSTCRVIFGRHVANSSIKRAVKSSDDQYPNFADLIWCFIFRNDDPNRLGD